MGQICHDSATNTHAVRAAIQRSQTSIVDQRRELGINPKTVASWRKSKTVEGKKIEPTLTRAAHARRMSATSKLASIVTSITADVLYVSRVGRFSSSKKTPTRRLLFGQNAERDVAQSGLSGLVSFK